MASPAPSSSSSACPRTVDDELRKLHPLRVAPHEREIFEDATALGDGRHVGREHTTSRACERRRARRVRRCRRRARESRPRGRQALPGGRRPRRPRQRHTPSRHPRSAPRRGRRGGPRRDAGVEQPPHATGRLTVVGAAGVGEATGAEEHVARRERPACVGAAGLASPARPRRTSMAHRPAQSWSSA